MQDDQGFGNTIIQAKACYDGAGTLFESMVEDEEITVYLPSSGTDLPAYVVVKVKRIEVVTPQTVRGVRRLQWQGILSEKDEEVLARYEENVSGYIDLNGVDDTDSWSIESPGEVSFTAKTAS
jgi:hypothetical protein